MSPNGENKAGRFGRAFFSAKGRGVWLLAIVLTVAGALPSVVGGVSAQEDGKAIHSLRLESTQPGELELAWDAPTETPTDYRVSWARVGESFRTWTDSEWNAFPTTPLLTITGLDEGVSYKVKVRARYRDIGNGRPGSWCEPVEAVVAASQTATPTATATDTATPTATHTPTATSTPTPGDSRSIAVVRLASSQAGVLEVTWDAAAEAPTDYRLSWARTG